MPPFHGSEPYDRARILDAAARARAKKKRARAIALYRQALAFEPKSVELHAKLAPLLAETGQHFDAWCSFRAVARSCLQAGHADRALAVYREATLYLPREVEAWQAVARIQIKAGRRREALETLLEGSRNFHTRWLGAQAIYLLRRAREIDAWDFEVVLELALLLAASEQRAEARLLLDGLAERCTGDRLQRVRAAQVRVSPGPGAAWRWLCELFRGRAAFAPPVPERSLVEPDPPSLLAPEPSRLRDEVAASRARRPAVVPLRAARRA